MKFFEEEIDLSLKKSVLFRENTQTWAPEMIKLGRGALKFEEGDEPQNEDQPAMQQEAMEGLAIRREYSRKMIVFLALLDNKINRQSKRTPTEDKHSQRSRRRGEFTVNDMSDYETGGLSLREGNRVSSLPR